MLFLSKQSLNTFLTLYTNGFISVVLLMFKYRSLSFRVNSIESPVTSDWNGDCGESLTLYDAAEPDDTKIIKTFCDTFSKPAEKHDFISTGNSMFIRFESKTGSYSG